MQTINQKNKINAYTFLLVQLAIGTLITALIGIFGEVFTAKSFMIGVLLDLLPSFVFVLYAFRFSGARQIQLVATSFYRGETVKILITAALFVAIAKFIPVEFSALFIGFLVMKVSYFIKPIFF